MGSDYIPRHAASGDSDPDDESENDLSADVNDGGLDEHEPSDAADMSAGSHEPQPNSPPHDDAPAPDEDEPPAHPNSVAGLGDRSADDDNSEADQPDSIWFRQDPDDPEFWQEAGGVTAEEFLDLDTSAQVVFDQDVGAGSSVYTTGEESDAAKALEPGEELKVSGASSNRPPRNYGAFAQEPTHEDDDDRGGFLPLILALVAAGVVAVLAFLIFSNGGDDGTDAVNDVPTVGPTIPPIPTPTPVPATPTPVPTATPTPYPGWSDPTASGQPWGREVEGLLTFRGNPTRSYYGSGPMPVAPSVQWTYPEGRLMCGNSTVGATTTQWCGTGWTGQPAVFERDDRTWTVFGAYDYGIHFVDADTGEAILPPFQTGDIIKGSVTIDPDGYPLVYSGSRDNFLHVVAFDRETPEELWRLSADAVQPQLWNNDWDASPMVIGDYLFEGGENSVFHIVKLNRGYDADGFVTVDPELVFFTPGWDQALIDAVGINVSIENSVAISGNTVYFANSGGLVQGWDITGLEDGAVPQQTFRYWVGDDTDATIVIDDEGFLYVGVEWERLTARSNEVGQLVKLDPSNPDNPVVWSVFAQAYQNDGVWATPAIYEDMVYASTDSGRLLGIDRMTGEIIWEKLLPNPVWSSQVVVDDVLIQGDCIGVMHAYDVSDTRVDPPELWSVQVADGCIESTPAVWGGRIIVGTRAGQMHMVGDDPAEG